MNIETGDNEKPISPLVAVAIIVPTNLHFLSPPGNFWGAYMMAWHFEKAIKAAGATWCSAVAYGEFNKSFYLVKAEQQQVAFRAIKDVLEESALLRTSEIGWEAEAGTFVWRVFHSRGNGELLNQITEASLSEWKAEVQRNMEEFIRRGNQQATGQDLEGA
jgi:hypothetical protein